MASSEATEATSGDGAGHKGLKANAIGFWDGLAIGLDSTAPAYSLAATLGSLVVIAGTQAPGVMLISFIPIFLIAGAFYYMNRADQDCGTTFSWVTRAMGPTLGWLGGWAIFTTGVLVIGSLADVAALYTFQLFGLTSLAESRPAVVIFAVIIIVVMTWLCVIGTELSAKVQRVLVLSQVAILLLFVVVALYKLATGTAPEGSVTPSISWLLPTGLDSTSLISGMLLAVFIYWGWESAVNLTEESTDSATSPGKAALVSTLVLLVTYVGVAVAMIAVVGTDAIAEYDDSSDLFSGVGEIVLGPLAFLLVLSIVTSGLASTQTTILPASRTSLSMAVAGAFPEAFAKVHPKFGTPAFGTWFIGIAAAVWYVVASSYSENFLFDSLSALSLLIAFYYALTGIACAIYWRKRLLTSPKAFLFVGVGPVLGAIMLLVLLAFSVISLANPEESYSGSSILGIGVPLAIALFFILLGVILMIVWRFGPGKAYFARKGGERVSDEVALAALGPTAPGSDRGASR